MCRSGENLREQITRITMPAAFITSDAASAEKTPSTTSFVGRIFESNTMIDLAMTLQCFMYSSLSGNATELFVIWFGPSSRPYGVGRILAASASALDHDANRIAGIFTSCQIGLSDLEYETYEHTNPSSIRADRSRHRRCQFRQCFFASICSRTNAQSRSAAFSGRL